MQEKLEKNFELNFIYLPTLSWLIVICFEPEPNWLADKQRYLFLYFRLQSVVYNVVPSLETLHGMNF